ncbi:hypothetical protein EFY79_11390 [Hanamia caeni]|uniref:Uncharacterized protein n=1 Tax=Hanamia caeni TaxID=2294116 RepID=A0A3M9NER3_9BACT|nr:hypothetical protein EFY79_11390 [Hanamia caeni]
MSIFIFLDLNQETFNFNTNIWCFTILCNTCYLLFSGSSRIQASKIPFKSFMAKGFIRFYRKMDFYEWKKKDINGKLILRKRK